MNSLFFTIARQTFMVYFHYFVTHTLSWGVLHSILGLPKVISFAAFSAIFWNYFCLIWSYHGQKIIDFVATMIEFLIHILQYAVILSFYTPLNSIFFAAQEWTMWTTLISEMYKLHIGIMTQLFNHTVHILHCNKCSVCPSYTLTFIAFSSYLIQCGMLYLYFM